MFGENMRFSKKSVVATIFLTILSTYLTIYTWKAHTIATRHIYEDLDGEPVAWRTGPSGSLFPWPRESGMLQIFSEINEVDLFIYRYLIKTWGLVGLSILLWICTGLLIFKVIEVEDVEKEDIDKKLHLTDIILASASGPFITLLSGFHARSYSLIGAAHTDYGFPLSWYKKVVIVYPGDPTCYSFSFGAFVLDIVFWSLIATLLVVIVYRRSVLKVLHRVKEQ